MLRDGEQFRKMYLAFNSRKSLISLWFVNLNLHNAKRFQLLTKVYDKIINNIICIKYFLLLAISDKFSLNLVNYN